METFYKITKAQANLIGKFEYATNQAIDPYCSEQKDGTYIVSEMCYELLKAHPKFMKVDFSKLSKVDSNNLNTKEL